MHTSRIYLPSRLAVCLVGFCLATPQARAELYKCHQADGQVSYQQNACDDIVQGDRLAVDTSRPSGSADGTQTRDYSIESQLKEMQTQREQARKERERARKQAEADARQSTVSVRTEFDPAKCTKQRAEVAKWHQKVLNGYRTRSEKDLNENKLAHHQALADRYCD